MQVEMPDVDIDEIFLKLGQVCEKVGFRESKIWDDIKKGRFPAGIKVGSSTRWLNSEIARWQREQIERARGQQ